MAKKNKFWELDEGIVELINEVRAKETPDLHTLGLNFLYLGTANQSVVLKVQKGSPLLEYIADEEQLITITVYEEAFKMLKEVSKRMIIAHALSAIDFDRDKDRVTINNYNGTTLDKSIYLKYQELAVFAIFEGEEAVRLMKEKKKE